MNKGILKHVCVFAVAVCVIASAQMAVAQSSDAYKKAPGYVDFDAMNIFGDLEPNVEVFLKGALLKMALSAVESEEPDLAEALENIVLVSVNVFELDRASSEMVGDKTQQMAETLEGKGWDMAVRVRDDDQQVYVYVLPTKGNDDSIDGLVVMVHEDRDEAVFVNIVGTVNAADIGRLGRAFDIDAFDDFDYDHGHMDDDDDDDGDTKRKSRTNNRDSG